ncbi:Protein phosphatase 2C manganese/magnesium aspartate binding site [Lasiodiplodia theobromae]|uniref:Protein phosphatase 2C-like protein 4 n=1 Tax=Lasiodiplodia theobromae TaxID=45133 RepID=A0A5N5DI61_9PEZI|nr:Protein phosphatase 2C manganese/magnesium aspartate binding site [Lasiodiplodia theobromae]KAB2577568.1 Protein phosphatase 2C-like protein 4 [Lasiodiplodia theobromae]KAF4535544.1 Protein phosphatase 2C manganese/magnesium aspartate binding site [Lasiodiplodia theobromae]KAF9638829.1 Protein phosphatase 2C manganese/magnesium aspartate binding site [Lasiodiplodia theobromae]
MCTPSIRIVRAGARPSTLKPPSCRHRARCFHDYFVTHLPSSSLHPDQLSSAGPGHKLPRDKSTPHTQGDDSRLPAAAPPFKGARETTVVRIPLRSAKHHFGVSVSRGQRPYNEDAFQAGTIEIPAFAKRQPISLTRSKRKLSENTSADSASGDPQVFYFGIFDGHGGNECSDFLRERLHEYLEDSTRLFELKSSLPQKTSLSDPDTSEGTPPTSRESLEAIDTHTPPGTEPARIPDTASGEAPPSGRSDTTPPPDGAKPVKQSENVPKALQLEREIVVSWRELVGGYFKRFKPDFFSTSAGGKGHTLEREVVQHRQLQHTNISDDVSEGVGIETVLTYAFLKADFDFVSAQVNKADEDLVEADRAINDEDILERPSHAGKRIGGPKRFKGGSTCSIALISTPTPAPYWTPGSASTIVTAHVGDTRIILCNTATGQPIPLTSNHHPSLPSEEQRLRRYAAAFATDSFGEERIFGLANTRAFGDMHSKRVGVSAEPEIRRIELAPAEYSFMVMVSDGVSGTLSDQEIVDIVKDARTPEQGARDVVSFATEVSRDGDNATALVVRLGGWERRSEGGLGSLGTKELRDWRRKEAEDPRSGRR